MEKNIKPAPIGQKQAVGGNPYLIRILLLMFVFPGLSILLEYLLKKTPVDPALIGKWFIFWDIGFRLFTAGVSQTVRPGFTATKIFHLKEKESYPIIRELGFANIALGTMGMLSLINGEWRLIAAITGGLFFGLAGIQHLFKKPDSFNEIIAMVTDQFVFIVMLLYLSFMLFS